MASNDGLLVDTICVSNLPEDVSILQLVEQFGMVGSVKVGTVVIVVTGQ